MKSFSIILLLFGLIALSSTQYGIPDEEDEPKAKVPNPAFTISKYEAPTREVTRPKATSAPSYEVKKTSPYAPPPDHETKFTVTTTHVDFKSDKPTASYEKSAPLRVAHQPIIFKSADVPVQKVEFVSKDNSYSSSAARFPSPAIVRDSYSRQRVFPESKREAVPIVKYVLEDDQRGSFRLETVSGDGTTKFKSGQLKDLGGKEGPVQVMAGSYSFTSDDGKLYKVDWTADEKGFKAVGDHLP